MNTIYTNPEPLCMNSQALTSATKKNTGTAAPVKEAATSQKDSVAISGSVAREVSGRELQNLCNGGKSARQGIVLDWCDMGMAGAGVGFTVLKFTMNPVLSLIGFAAGCGLGFAFTNIMNKVTHGGMEKHAAGVVISNNGQGRSYRFG